MQNIENKIKFQIFSQNFFSVNKLEQLTVCTDLQPKFSILSGVTLVLNCIKHNKPDF